MEKFYLAALSEFNHQEGFLKFAIENLVERGVASEGFDGDDEHFLTILYDVNKNPYLFFKDRDAEKAVVELERRIVRAEKIAEFSDIRLMNELLSPKTHREIQDEYSYQKLHTINCN